MRMIPMAMMLAGAVATAAGAEEDPKVKAAQGASLLLTLGKLCSSIRPVDTDALNDQANKMMTDAGFPQSDFDKMVQAAIELEVTPESSTVACAFLDRREAAQ